MAPTRSVPLWLVVILLSAPTLSASMALGPSLLRPAESPDAVEGAEGSIATDAAGIQDACRASGSPTIPCVTTHLQGVLRTHGSEAAFSVLDELARTNREIDAASHPMAHQLGIFALDVYGSIQDALATCSYKLFAGCFHGALQAHFSRLETVDAAAVRGVCLTEDPFREYTCLHGLGHGLMLATTYDLNASLDLCARLATKYAESSCAGGVFMENFAGWQEAQDATTAAFHQHLGTSGAEPRYSIDPLNLDYPCDAVASRALWDCWFFHTSVVLYLNGGNFTDVIHRCSAIQSSAQDACYKSVGRDASAYEVRDPTRGGAICMRAVEPGRGLCAKGFVADSVVSFADPRAGLGVCLGFPIELKTACYEELAVQGRSIAPSSMAGVCAEVEFDYSAVCRRAGGVV